MTMPATPAIATQWLTMTVAGCFFGLPIARVREVFVAEAATPVPLAPPDIAGILNLRGRIITMIDLRCCLGLAPQADSSTSRFAVGFDAGGDSYGLLVDALGDLLDASTGRLLERPAQLQGRIAQVCSGIWHRGETLVIILDADRILDVKAPLRAA